MIFQVKVAKYCCRIFGGAFLSDILPVESGQDICSVAQMRCISSNPILRAETYSEIYPSWLQFLIDFALSRNVESNIQTSHSIKCEFTKFQMLVNIL